MSRAGSNADSVLQKLRTNELLTAATAGLVGQVDVLLGSSPDFTADVLGAALLSASKNGHGAVVAALLAAGATIDGVEGHYSGQKTPLMMAARNGHVEVVDFLLNAGANVTYTNNVFMTALCYASNFGHAEVVKSLLAAGAPVEFDIKTSRVIKMTPLILAAQTGNVEVVELLLKAGANVAAFDEKRRTALCFAARRGHLQTVAALLAAGAPVEGCDHFKQTPLVQAAEGGHVNVIELLLAGGANVGLMALSYAAAKGNIEAATSLIAAGAPVDGIAGSIDFNGDHGRPIIEAAKNGHVHVIELLLASGAAIEATDSVGWTGLFYAAAFGHVEAAAFLLAAGADAEVRAESQKTPLMQAALGGHVKVVELLVSEGTNLEAVAENWTALLYAVCNGHVETVCALIRAGARLDGEGTGWTPLYLATKRADVVRKLLAAGADPDGGFYLTEVLPDGSISRTGLAGTPLMKAASDIRLGVVRILLKGGANVNAAVTGGLTALMTGASSGDPEVVKTLLKAGADPFAQLDENVSQSEDLVRKTALDIASKDAIKELLKREMERRKAAALSMMPANIPLHTLQEIISLAYAWNPSS